jgi:hypothetical protein
VWIEGRFHAPFKFEMTQQMNPAQQNQNMQHVKASKAILGLSDSSQCQDA